MKKKILDIESLKVKPKTNAKPPATSLHFRRYTTLSALIHMLQTKSITLLNPATWDDKNDAYYMSEYKRILGVKSVLAICFAECSETYHHWRVFSNGSDGVCIEFDRDILLEAFKGNPGIKMRNVHYSTVAGLRQRKVIKVDDLPFLKRKPYEDEKEYRVVYVDAGTSKEFENFPISLSCIERVTLSPWINKSLRKSVQTTLQSINDDCKELDIIRSTLIGNTEWQEQTSKAV